MSSVVALVPALAAPAVAPAGAVERITSLCWATAAFTAPMNGLRVTRYLTLSDVLLTAGVAGVLVTTPALPRLDARVQYPVLAGLAALAAGGVIGSSVVAPSGPDMAGVARFVFATIGSIVAMTLWGSSRRQLRRFCATWVGGAVVSSLWAVTLSPTIVGRPIGLASHPNNLGLACVLGLGPATGWALGLRGPMRRVALGAGAILLVGLLASGSRAAIVGAGVVVTTVAVLLSRRRLALVAGIAAAVMCVAIVIGVLRPLHGAGPGRVLGDRTTMESDSGRRELLARSVDRVRRHPITGEGFARAGEAHNIYLQALVAGGVLGIVGLGVVATSIMATGLAAVRRGTTGDDEPLLAGLLAGYAGYLAASCFQNNLSERYLWLYIAALLVLLGSRTGQAR